MEVKQRTADRIATAGHNLSQSVPSTSSAKPWAQKPATATPSPPRTGWRADARFLSHELRPIIRALLLRRNI